MRRLSLLAAVLVLLCMGITSASATDGWSTFIIRGANSGGGLPTITPGAGDTVNFNIPLGGQKAGWGTNSLNGIKLSDFVSASITRTDGLAPPYSPYANFWITDGAKFAVIGVGPSIYPALGNAGTVSVSWDAIKTLGWKYQLGGPNTYVYENDAMVGTGTLADFANWTIQAPTVAQLTGGWAGLGSGAPDQINTNVAYGFTWVFGDTGANYSGPGYNVSNPSATAAVPEPMSIMLGIMGLGSVAGFRKLRRK